MICLTSGADRGAGERILHLSIELTDDVLMPAVRAHMLLAALGEHGEIVGSVPAQSGVELFQGRQVQVWVLSQHEDEVLVATASGITDVRSVAVADAERDDAERATAGAQAADARITANEALLAVSANAGPTVAVREDNPSSKAARTVRVDAERLDALMHSMGELVIHRTAVEALTSSLDVPGLHQAMQELTRSSQSLQAMVMQVRMIPVEVVFLRFPRLVRDLSNKLGKQVELKLVGSDTELDRTVVDALGDPLVHLVRNALDHGLESPSSGPPPASRRRARSRSRPATPVAA